MDHQICKRWSIDEQTSVSWSSAGVKERVDKLVYVMQILYNIEYTAAIIEC